MAQAVWDGQVDARYEKREMCVVVCDYCGAESPPVPITDEDLRDKLREWSRGHLEAEHR